MLALNPSLNQWFDESSTWKTVATQMGVIRLRVEMVDNSG
jgi:hypothetical protein